MKASNTYRPIRDYGIIGDAHTAALIAKDGAIDWFCCPRFDSPAAFCRILDTAKGGYFRVGPASEHESARTYIGRTNILATTFSTHDGQFRLIDFMPVRDTDKSGTHMPRILRLLEGGSGSCEVEVRFAPSFDYARKPAEISLCEGGVIARSSGDEAFALSCPGTFGLTPSGAVTRLRIASGERVWIAPNCSPNSVPSAFNPAEADTDLKRTLDYWEKWSAACTYTGPYHDLVRRSALTLKLLIHEPTGALVAAPTTSLPEVIGGVGNWDYRFTWLRDSALSLDALMLAGYHDEAARFFDWLEDLCLCCDRALKIMYSLDGTAPPDEETLDHLDGYRGSRPVRIGNGTAMQRNSTFTAMSSTQFLSATRNCRDRCVQNFGREYDSSLTKPPRIGASLTTDRGRFEGSGNTMFTQNCSAGSRWTAP